MLVNIELFILFIILLAFNIKEVHKVNLLTSEFSTTIDFLYTRIMQLILKDFFEWGK